MEEFGGSNVVSASESTISNLPGAEGKDDYEQESNGVSGSVCVKEYMPWFMEQDSVSFALFVQEFGFVDLEDAKAASSPSPPPLFLNLLPFQHPLNFFRFWLPCRKGRFTDL
jgi:hypothetical protein